MAARNAGHRPPKFDAGDPPDVDAGGPRAEAGRYSPLPTGTHGLTPDLVKRDQRERLEKAMIDLIAHKGYAAVRIGDLAKLAHVSQPTFYSLYADKEDLFLNTYDDVAARTARQVIAAYEVDGSQYDRLIAAMRAFAELANTEPEAISLLVLGAFGAGSKVLQGRTRMLERVEESIGTSRDGAPPAHAGDLTIKLILGGIREVTAARLRVGRASELPALADELAAWASCYPRRLPPGLDAPPVTRSRPVEVAEAFPSERARAAEGRLPSGRSDLPRQFIIKSQRERIVDATAAIVAEQGLAGLTIPEIARRANVSHQTFYSIYASKHDAFMGAQKVGMHQALRVYLDAYESHTADWPSAARAGLLALIDYLASEPAHAHLSLVDTFAASPEAIDVRHAALHAFAAYFDPGYELAGGERHVPAIAAEATAGGIWQVLHYYIENGWIAELCGAAPQLVYFCLTPFVGPTEAAAYAALDSA